MNAQTKKYAMFCTVLALSTPLPALAAFSSAKEKALLLGKNIFSLCAERASVMAQTCEVAAKAGKSQRLEPIPKTEDADVSEELWKLYSAQTQTRGHLLPKSSQELYFFPDIDVNTGSSLSRSTAVAKGLKMASPTLLMAAAAPAIATHGYSMVDAADGFGTFMTTILGVSILTTGSVIGAWVSANHKLNLFIALSNYRELGSDAINVTRASDRLLTEEDKADQWDFQKLYTRIEDLHKACTKILASDAYLPDEYADETILNVKNIHDAALGKLSSMIDDPRMQNNFLIWHKKRYLESTQTLKTDNFCTLHSTELTKAYMIERESQQNRIL